MRLTQIVEVAEARPFSPNTSLDREVLSAFVSDLMSDVLCQDVHQGLLITSLANPQALRTAEMAEVTAVLMVGGKQPLPETLRLARELDIPLLGTELSAFDVCYVLGQAGLPSCGRSETKTEPAWCPDVVD